MNKLHQKQVLVTGGCGFIGKNLTQDLINNGAKVTVLDLPSADWKNLPTGAKKIKANIMDKKALNGVFKNIQIIYHLAARPDLDGANLYDYRVNFEGTQNIIEEAAKGKSVERFVFYSTQLVVGLFNETRFISESEPYKTKTIYGESKIVGEKITIEHCQKYGIDYTIIRPTSVYGPWGEMPYKEFFKTIKNRHYFHVGKANNLVSWVYVKNLVNLTIISSLSPKAKNEIYFGNDAYPYTMRQIVDCVGEYYNIRIRTIPNWLLTLVAYCLAPLKMLGLKVPIYPFRLKNIKANYCYDITKSFGINYHPEYNLEKGIGETLSWYEERGLI